MKLEKVHHLISSRKLFLINDDERKEVNIIIGKPVKLQGFDDYYCPYQIIGMGSEKVDYAIGIDGIQAIQLALKVIGIKLYTSDEKKQGKLIWEGDENGDLGFPVPDGLGILFQNDSSDNQYPIDSKASNLSKSQTEKTTNKTRDNQLSILKMRLLIAEALLIACKNIKIVKRIIENKDSKEKLIKTFSFTKEQAQALIELKTPIENIESTKVIDEINRLKAEIIDLEGQ